ncbi:hypothetical protein AAG747_26790 [Rapidithrix thailandica]|uniref:Uncharacterized protein n=1 Tax=Rapidithrix thailandica TaxID=413964 RepID=A0AAW9S5N4_9BACT
MINLEEYKDILNNLDDHALIISSEGSYTIVNLNYREIHLIEDNEANKYLISLLLEKKAVIYRNLDEVPPPKKKSESYEDWIKSKGSKKD